jgi:hypothetical protein
MFFTGVRQRPPRAIVNIRLGRATVHGGHALKHELGWLGRGRRQEGVPAAVHGRQVRACVTGRAAQEERGAAEQGIQLAAAGGRDEGADGYRAGKRTRHDTDELPSVPRAQYIALATAVPRRWAELL